MLGEKILDDLRTTAEVISKQEVEPLYGDIEAGIAIGAGDSYAAALVIEAATGGRVRAFDPDHLLAISSLKYFVRQGYTLFALSVGGRTREVVRVAELYRKAGGRVVAVTADEQSPLARTASSILLTGYGGTVRGIGVGRHIAMLAALAKAFGAKPTLPKKCGECPAIGIVAGHVGVGDSYSTAVFASLKAYEVFSIQSRYGFVEQLLHAEIYGMPKTLYIYESSSSILDARIKETVNILGRAGYNVSVIKRLSNKPWQNAISQQYCLLRCLAVECIEKRIKKPQYSRSPWLSDITNLIYHAQ